MGSPLVEHVASLLSATISPGLPSLFAALVSELPAGLFWIVAAVVLVIAGLRAGGLALHRQQPGRDRREALVDEGVGPRGADHRAGWRGGVSGGGAPRRHAFRPLAVAVPDPQGAAGLGAARQDRLRLRPRRRGALAEPDAGPGHSLQQLPGCPPLPGRRADQPRAGAGRRSAGAAAGHPARRRLRDQHRAVHGHDRGHGLPPGSRRLEGAEGAGQLAERAEPDRRLQPGDHRRAGRGARPAQSRARRSWSTASGS